MGFYTTRFVDAASEAMAAEAAIELVKADSAELTLVEHPWDLVVSKIELVPDDFGGEVRGYTFFLESVS